MRISEGREFQKVGAATLKALFPKVRRLESSPESEDRCRLREGVCWWRRPERYWGGQGVEGFVGEEEEEFVGDAVFHREPV